MSALFDQDSQSTTAVVQGEGVEELHSRQGDGIVVMLWWDKETNEVWLDVTDVKFPAHSFHTVVPNDRAMDAFRHPFAYAA